MQMLFQSRLSRPLSKPICRYSLSSSPIVFLNICSKVITSSCDRPVIRPDKTEYSNSTCFFWINNPSAVMFKEKARLSLLTEIRFTYPLLTRRLTALVNVLLGICNRWHMSLSITSGVVSSTRKMLISIVDNSPTDLNFSSVILACSFPISVCQISFSSIISSVYVKSPPSKVRISYFNNTKFELVCQAAIQNFFRRS